MHAAVKFQLDHLGLKCSEFLKGKINGNNFITHTKSAIDFGLKEYMGIICDYFGQNAARILKEESTFEASQEVISVLFGCDEVHCSELDLFLFSIEWAKRKCLTNKIEENTENIRCYLGDILDKIRFGTMEISDFQTGVVPTQVLTYEEMGRIIVTMGKVDTRTVDQNLVSNFSSKTSDVLKSDEFKKLSLKTITNLYSTEWIQDNCPELDLFTAAMEWAKVNKPTENDFQRVLDNIRFPLMPMKDFLEKVVPENVLTFEQMGQIIFQMQTQQKVSPYSDESREKKVQVSIWNLHKYLSFSYRGSTKKMVHLKTWFN